MVRDIQIAEGLDMEMPRDITEEPPAPAYQLDLVSSDYQAGQIGCYSSITPLVHWGISPRSPLRTTSCWTVAVGLQEKDTGIPWCHQTKEDPSVETLCEERPVHCPVETEGGRKKTEDRQQVKYLYLILV